MSRVAIYARYSSDLQSAASIEDQVRLCRERATQEGHAVVEVFSDYAISGGGLKTRPGMIALMEAARAGQMDLVLAEALDRISRDQEDVAGIFKRLAHNEVGLITLAEGPINELHVGLKGTMNALFLKDLAAKTRRGQLGRVEAGKIPGGNSYGYRMIRRIGPDGALVRGEREIDPAQAAIVRRIFAAYAAGATPRAIAADLNADGIPGPRGGYWNASTINGSRQRRNGILNNELYIGRITYNRQRFVKDPDTGKRISRPNPEAQWTVKKVPELRIIDADTWETVQTLKARYSSQAGNKRQTRKRLLSGLVRCGTCGGGMTIVNRERYSCAARRERGTCDSPAGIRAADLEARVLDGLRDILLGRDDLIAEFEEAFRSEVARLHRTRGQERTRLHKELAQVTRGIDRCLAFITDGDGTPDSVRGRLTELEVRKRELERELCAHPSEQNLVLHPNMGALYRRKLEALCAVLEAEGSRPRAMEIIRSMIDCVEVSPGPHRGAPEVVLVGALASILAFAAQAETENAAVGDGGVRRVLMVAGAGFEPATFRL